MSQFSIKALVLALIDLEVALIDLKAALIDLKAEQRADKNVKKSFSSDCRHFAEISCQQNLPRRLRNKSVESINQLILGSDILL